MPVKYDKNQSRIEKIKAVYFKVALIFFFNNSLAELVSQNYRCISFCD